MPYSSISKTSKSWATWVHTALLYIVYEHWPEPETREFITQTVELWNRWIRLVMLLQQSIEHVSIVYKRTTYFVMRWSM